MGCTGGVWPGTHAGVAGASLAQSQGTALTERWLAKRLEAMPDRMGQGQVEPVVRHLVELKRTSHLETKATAQQHKRDVVQRVRVAFAQFVGPDDERVVEQ